MIANLVKKIMTRSMKLRLWNIIYSFGLNKTGRQNKRTYKNNKYLFPDCKKALYQMATNGDCKDFPIYIESYKNKNIRPIKLINIQLKENDPILICAVKDDLCRIKVQIDYHRKIGIKHFVYIDNMSKDGTFEYLEKQNDVSLFSVQEEFSGAKQCSWRKQVIDLLGYNKWYLTIDSDELFIYPGIETKPIDKYIDFLEERKIKSTLTFMLDMYSDNNLFKFNNHNYDIIKEYCYFDFDTYKIQKTIMSQYITGGPRMRLFSSKTKKFNLCATKYSLVKASQATIIGIHQHYPLNLNFDTPLPIGILLHYKFLPQDISKYKEQIESGIMSEGSSAQSTYLKAYDENQNVSFYYDRSQKFNNSMDLLKVNIINKDFFNDFLSMQ